MSVRAAQIASVSLLAACAVMLAACAPAFAAPGFGQIKGAGGCVGSGGPEGIGPCTPANGLVRPAALTVSPDGRNVYVVGGESGSYISESFGSVVILARDPATGQISNVGCLSSDGTGGGDGASGQCAVTPSLLGADGVAVSPDGRTLLVTADRSGSVVAFARDPAAGGLTRIGCLAAARVGSPCPAANIFRGSSEVVVSPEGSAVFLASPTEGTVSALLVPPSPPGAAEPSSGGLASLFAPPPPPVPPIDVVPNPCIAVNGYDGGCAVGVAMKRVRSLTMSPDGKELYASAPASQAVDAFSASPSHPIVQVGCLKSKAPQGPCTDSRLLSSPGALAVSPDGRNVYAADSGEGRAKIDILARDAATGKLSDAGCVDFLPEPPKAEPGSGEESSEEEQENAKQREDEERQERERLASDPCHSVPGLESVQAIAVSGDGSAVWALGAGTAVSFSRDPATGALAETACASSSDSRCAPLGSIGAFDAAAVSPDGRNVYVATGGDGDAANVIAFGIGASVSAASASADRAGVAHVSVACPSALRGPCRGRLVLTRRHRVRRPRGARGGSLRLAAGASPTFSIAPGHRARIAVRLIASARGLLVGHRSLAVTATVRGAGAGGSGLGRRIVLRLGPR